MYLVVQFAVGLLYLQAILGRDILTICSHNESAYEGLLLKVIQLETRITRQDAKLALQDAKLSKQDAELTQVHAKDMALEARMALLKENVDKSFTTWNESKHVASFLAVRTQSPIPSAANVVFDKVTHNVAPPGFGYDRRIGHYRCPYDGTYAFYVNILCDSTSGSNQHYAFNIKKEGTVLVTASTDVSSATATDDVPATAMAVTPCRKGEDVWVQNADSSSRSILTSDGKTHFVGFKIY